MNYIEGLKNNFPNYSCTNLWRKRQYFNILALLIFGIFVFYTGVDGFILSLNIIAFVIFAYKVVLLIAGLKRKNKEILATENLPKYCILLPIRNEKPEVVEELIQNIENINYPKNLLDVKLLIDEDDEYLKEVSDLDLPKYFNIVSAPAIFPFTKPKVCNFGLEKTNAEIVTIYDVEDKPDPNQLLKVVKRFQEDEKLSCVQCSLNYNNGRQNILTSFFSNEYLSWFSYCLRGLERIQGKYPIIPLGGTSQHIKIKDLNEVGGWDAFNVTEDCDLGIRLARESKKVSIMNSVTEEKAAHRIRDWIPQRTRWQMGYMVTYLTHSSKIIRLTKDIGIVGLFHFYMNIFGSFLNLLITPILFILFVQSLLGFLEIGEFLVYLSYVVLIGNYILVVITHIIPNCKKNRIIHIITALFQPFYYLLQSIVVYRAAYKLITATYKWEKTEHH